MFYCSSAYEIVLGGWTSSDHGCAIRRVLGGTQLVRIYEAGVVSCDEDRYVMEDYQNAEWFVMATGPSYIVNNIGNKDPVISTN